MKIFRINTSIWYKSLHVFFACAWFGSVLAVILIYLFTSGSNEEIILNNGQLIEKVDQFVIIPSSLLCYLFGIVLSWRTSWGFIKYKWVFIKIILGTGLILFGIFFLGPWIMASNNTDNINDYQHIQNKLGAAMIVQAIIIGTTILISTTKPWGKLKQK